MLATYIHTHEMEIAPANFESQFSREKTSWHGIWQVSRKPVPTHDPMTYVISFAGAIGRPASYR